MMDVLSIPRTAVDRSLRVLRLPVDTTISVFRRQSDRDSGVSLMVDRADAAVRGLAGRVLRDDRLQQDGKARSVAVDERVRALELRTEAELREQRADQEFEGDLQTADERRAEAAQRAADERARIEAEQQAERRQVAEQTERRKAATRKAAADTEQSIEAIEERARLEQLEQEAEVLDAKEHAVTTSSEAQRLQRAASQAKNKRKSD
jgi:hypothetical protein